MKRAVVSLFVIERRWHGSDPATGFYLGASSPTSRRAANFVSRSECVFASSYSPSYSFCFSFPLFLFASMPGRTASVRELERFLEGLATSLARSFPRR